MRRVAPRSLVTTPAIATIRACRRRCGPGRLVRYLQAERPEAQIVVTADHGEAFNDHGESLHGTNLYEEQIHVPLGAGRAGIPAGVYRDPVQLVDIAPTLLQLAGEHRAGDVRRTHSASGAAGRGSRFTARGLGLASQYALIAWPWKLTRDLRTDETQLYDLAADPGETQDQSQSQATTRLRLRESLLAGSTHACGLPATWPWSPTGRRPQRRSCAAEWGCGRDVRAS